MSNIPTKDAIVSVLNKDIESKITDLKKNLDHLKESLNSETKSSMGDKYETSRSMIHAEIENYTKQHSVLVHDQNVLKSISKTAKSDKTDFGSLILTSKGLYFLAIGIGKVIIEDQPIYCVSPNSPIGQKFQNKKAGDLVEFMDYKIEIKSIQ